MSGFAPPEATFCAAVKWASPPPSNVDVLP